MSAPVVYEALGGVARITFSRPERLNALDAASGRAFEQAVRDALANEDTRVVLLRGEGRSFLAGGDLSGFLDAPDRGAAVADVIDPTHRALKMLADGPAITIAAAQGAVAGAGMSIFCGADIGIAAQGASFNMAYSRIGAVADCGGTWVLPRLLGLRRAISLALLSEPVSADEGLAMGLVTSVVPDDELDAAAMAMAEKLARGPALALRRTRDLIRAAYQTDYATQLDAEMVSFQTAAAHPDFAEGLAAFFGKRAPDYPSARGITLPDNESTSDD